MTDPTITEALCITDKWREELPNLVQPEHFLAPMIALADAYCALRAAPSAEHADTQRLMFRANDYGCDSTGAFCASFPSWSDAKAMVALFDAASAATGEGTPVPIYDCGCLFKCHQNGRAWCPNCAERHVNLAADTLLPRTL